MAGSYFKHYTSANYSSDKLLSMSRPQVMIELFSPLMFYIGNFENNTFWNNLSSTAEKSLTKFLRFPFLCHFLLMFPTQGDQEGSNNGGREEGNGVIFRHS